MKSGLLSFFKKQSHIVLFIFISVSIFLGIFFFSWGRHFQPASGTTDSGSDDSSMNSQTNNTDTGQPASDQQLSAYTITLDAGHGGYDPGKIGIDQSKEKDINLQIALCLKELLKARGINVFMTRDEDISLNTTSSGSMKTSDLRHRVEIAAANDSDFFISIHQNSFSDPSVHGAQVFYYEGSDPGKQLASSIQSSIRAIADSDNERPIKGNSDYLILKNSPCPAVIVECGFLSNPEECQSLNTPDYQKQMAAAIADGLINVLQNIK